MHLAVARGCSTPHIKTEGHVGRVGHGKRWSAVTAVAGERRGG